MSDHVEEKNEKTLNQFAFDDMFTNVLSDGLKKYDACISELQKAASDQFDGGYGVCNTQYHLVLHL